MSGANPSMGGAIGFALLDSDGAGTVGNTEGYLYFETKDSGASLTEKMRITSGGNVGIGTTNIDTDLHVKASSNAWTGGLKLEDFNAQNGWLLHPDTGLGLMIGEVYSNDPDMAVPRFIINKGGNVTINGDLTVGGNEVITAGNIDGTTYADTSHAITAIDNDNFYIDTDISGVLTQGTYELSAKLNPNIGESTGFCDFVYGKIIISNGYDLASNDKYIKHVNYVRENPQPRDLHATSGGSNHDISCVLFANGQEYESLPGVAGNWQTSTLRIKFNSRAHYFAKQHVNNSGVTHNYSGYFEMKLRKII
jgi:hypothetical protein